jgi:hypothetical protein
MSLDNLRPEVNLLSAFTFAIGGAFAMGLPMAVMIIWVCSRFSRQSRPAMSVSEQRFHHGQISSKDVVRVRPRASAHAPQEATLLRLR